MKQSDQDDLFPELVKALDECLHFVIQHKFDDNIQKAGDAMRVETKARAILNQCKGEA